MYQLRQYQSEACAATWDYLCRGAGNPAIVLPTGAGKSLVIAELSRAAVQDYGGRVIVLAHRAELLKQNAEKIASLLPFGVTCGIFSAGLRKYAMDDDVVCCGIQSVYKRAADFGRRHLVLIDEAHLVPDDNEGMYKKFLGELGELNPRLKVVGLTATPYRTSTGTICGPEKMFTGIAYSAKIPALIADGFLCPVTTEPTKDLYDTSKLHVRGGEFVAHEVESLFDDDGKTREACQEIAAKCRDRKSILIFSSGVQHAEHIERVLSGITGEQVGVVTGATLPVVRAAHLEAFKQQRLRWLVNVEVLSTGYDAPCIDAIAVLRATQSPGLFAQICGRGFRLHPNKQNCLIIDYGNNIKRHGPIDCDTYGVKEKKPREEIERPEGGGPGKKQCPACESWVPSATKVCEGDEERGISCGWIFANIDAQADTQSQILVAPKKWRVLGVHMNRHRKKSAVEGTPDTLRVTYTVEPCDAPIDETEHEYRCPRCFVTGKHTTIRGEWGPHKAKVICESCSCFIRWQSSGGNMAHEISEWICLEHPPGFASAKAFEWVEKRCVVSISDSMSDSPIDDAISLFQRGAFAETYSITTMREGRFDKVIDCDLGPRPESWQQPPEPIGYDEWGEPIYDEPLPDGDGLEDAPF